MSLQWQSFGTVKENYAHSYFLVTQEAEGFYDVGPLFGAKTVLTRLGMDSARYLKVCSGIGHQDISNRFH